jgi:hypothetical protein
MGNCKIAYTESAVERNLYLLVVCFWVSMIAWQNVLYKFYVKPTQILYRIPLQILFKKLET